MSNLNTITRDQKWHDLKCWPEIFNWMITGVKMFDVRINDRDYQVNDMLVLREWLPQSGEYTGRKIIRRVTYILAGGQFGIPENMIIMQLEKV